MKISVITVCLNDEKRIARTIDSVISQTTKNFEYIVCDGKSSDGTLGVIENYKEHFREKQISFSVTSEKDSGVYSAMNKAVAMAKGDYVCFLNAGDTFHDNLVLERVISAMTEEKDVYYGNIFFIVRKYGQLLRGDEKQLDKGMSICHQSMFTRRELMLNKKFDEDYRIIADYVFVKKALDAGCKFGYLDLVIADYEAGGISTTNSKTMIEEYERAFRELNLHVDMSLFRRNVRKNYRTYKIKKMIPFVFWSAYNKKKGRVFYDW